MSDHITECQFCDFSTSDPIEAFRHRRELQHLMRVRRSAAIEPVRDVLAFPKPVTFTDESYKRFIRREPCCVCGSGAQHHHVIPEGWGKTSAKVSDYRGAPLCWRCHREFHNLGRKRFEAKHPIDLAEVQIQCLEKYISALKDGVDLGAKQ
jgi:hypothetical protein